MRSFKTHFGVVVSLVALLFSLQFSFFINELLKNYEEMMSDSYSIVVVTKRDINATNLGLDAVKNISEISPEEMISRLKGKISDNSLKKLKASLPKFYSLNLQNFPTTSELNEISKRLEKLDFVLRVETFAKAHSEIYRVLVLMKNMTIVFSSLIVVLGLMLMFKQMRIWLFEHKKRVKIMTLFGAPYLIKSLVLYKMAIIDSFIATFLVSLFYFLLPKFEFFIKTIETIGVSAKTIVFPDQVLFLLAISLALSLLIVTFVMLSIKEEHR